MHAISVQLRKMREMSAAKAPPQPFSPIEGLDEPLKELKDELHCPLCLDFYTDPVALPCQHSFCRECVTGLVRPQVRVGSHGELECPLCRKKVHLDGTGGVEGLPRNFHLGEIVGKFHAVETRLDVIRTEQLAKQQLQKHTSEPEQQQPPVLHHQKQPEESTRTTGQTLNQPQGEPVMTQLQQNLEQLQLFQQRFQHQVDGIHPSNENKQIRPNCAKPADMREHRASGQQHRRQTRLGPQRIQSEVSQPGELAQTLQEHLHDSFRQIREERHNQQRVLHQQLGQQREEQQGSLQKLHQQLHQQRQQQQNQQQKLHQQLEQQREGQKRGMQKLHQQLRSQQHMMHQQLGRQREEQKLNLQKLQQQRQQQQNQQQLLQKKMQRQQQQGQMQLQQQQQQLQQNLNRRLMQQQRQQLQQQQGQRRTQQQ